MATYRSRPIAMGSDSECCPRRTSNFASWTVQPRERQFPHDHPICSPVFSAGGVAFSECSWSFSCYKMLQGYRKIMKIDKNHWWITEVRIRWGGRHAVYFLSTGISRLDRGAIHFSHIFRRCKLLQATQPKGFCSFFLYCPSGLRHRGHCIGLVVRPDRSDLMSLLWGCCESTKSNLALVITYAYWYFWNCIQG